jgi:hypothetical protein
VPSGSLQTILSGGASPKPPVASLSLPPPPPLLPPPPPAALSAPQPTSNEERTLQTRLSAGATLEALQSAIHMSQSGTLFVVRWTLHMGPQHQRALVETTRALDAFSRLCLLQRLGLVAADASAGSGPALVDAELGALCGFTAAVAQAMAERGDAATPEVAQNLAAAQQAADALRSIAQRHASSAVGELARVAISKVEALVRK